MNELVLTPPPAQNPPVPLKWCGSKGTLASTLSSLLLPMLAQGGRYIEPFLGSAAVFFALRARGWKGEAILSDLLEPLVNFYSEISPFPEIVYRVTLDIEAGYRASNDKRAYYKHQRQNFNEGLGGPCYRAGLFLWLNHRCFNGLWRTNKEGKFTTDWGGPRSYLPSLARLQEASRHLENAWPYCTDFEWTIAQTQPGDVVYADPPYAVGYRYYAGSFNEQHQARLASCLKAAWERGVTVIASNSDTPEIRVLYSWAEITPVSLRYRVSRENWTKGQEVILVARGAR